ncbi:MAG TPA: metallopeptidase [Chromatiales bacterium]|nr:metallopeptidase [Chromatiales bacterium]
METPLTLAQQNTVINQTHALIEQANRLFDLRLKPINVLFDIRGSAWGYYVRIQRDRLIRYNPWLFEKYFTEGMNDTVPHEVAHYVVDMRYRKHCKPHGAEWREVMQLFGVTQPRATSRHGLDGLPVRRQQRFRYACACQKHEISTTRHRRILRGQQYLCRRCHEAIRPATLARISHQNDKPSLDL